MSRIGKSPIAVPDGVTVTIDGSSIKVKGPKGELEQTIDPEIGVELNDNVLTFTRPSDHKDHRSKHGLYLKYAATAVGVLANILIAFLIFAFGELSFVSLSSNAIKLTQVLITSIG